METLERFLSEGGSGIRSRGFRDEIRVRQCFEKEFEKLDYFFFIRKSCVSCLAANHSVSRLKIRK